MIQKSRLKRTIQSCSKIAGQLAVFGSFIMISQAGAKVCPKNIAMSSIYFAPHIKDYCPTHTPCASFKKVVKMQGSGTLPGNKVLTYQGKVISLGSCDTVIGAAGKCLLPFISIAADARHFSMGDIISMPSIKGKTIQLPNGKKFIHPGFFVVHDTGGAIKGANRFDFFTGSYNLADEANAFGTKGPDETKIMTDKSDCSQTKRFTVIRRNSKLYGSATEAIEKALSEDSSGQTKAIQNNTSQQGIR